MTCGRSPVEPTSPLLYCRHPTVYSSPWGDNYVRASRTGRRDRPSTYVITLGAEFTLNRGWKLLGAPLGGWRAAWDLTPTAPDVPSAIDVRRPVAVRLTSASRCAA